MSKSTKWFIFNLSNILKNLRNQNETLDGGWTVTVIDHHTTAPMDLANSSISTTEGTITEVSKGQIQYSKSPQLRKILILIGPSSTMTWPAPAPTTQGPGFATRSPVNTTIGIAPNTNTTKGPDNNANRGPVNTTIGIDPNTNTTKGPDNSASRGPDVNTTIRPVNTNATKGPDNSASSGPVNTTIAIGSNTNTIKGPDNSTSRGLDANTTIRPDNSTSIGSDANRTIEPDTTTSIRPDGTTTTGV